MLYVFYGSDPVKTRTLAHEAIARHVGEGATPRMFSAEDYEEGAVRAIVSGVSLFGAKEITVFDMLSESERAFEELIECAPDMADAASVYVVIEGLLSVSAKKVLERVSTECASTKASESDRFNPFSLADALLRKDKKSLWLLLMRARRSGLSSEEIIGTLNWQLKSLWLGNIAHTADEAGMKEFPFSKARAGARAFTHEELMRLSESLIDVYHQGHLGADIELELEKWVLTI